MAAVKLNCDHSERYIILSVQKLDMHEKLPGYPVTGPVGRKVGICRPSSLM